MKTWGYGGAPNQKWAFERATQVGGAGAYRQVNSTEVNCIAYALGLNKWLSPGYANKSTVTGAYNMELFYNGLVSKIEGHGLHCRRLSGKDAYIRPPEYKIVARAGEQSFPEITRRDSHFMVQINTSAWAEKMGSLPSENLGYINPAEHSWNFVLPDPETGEPVNHYTGFYDSPLIYIAIWE